MKKFDTILLIMIPLLSFGQVNNFEYDQYESEYNGNTPYVALHGEIISLSTSSHNLTVTPLEREKPEGWLAYYCPQRVCLPLENVPSYTFELVPDDTAFFSFDVQTADIPGVGQWTIMVVDSVTGEVDSAQVMVGFLATGVDEHSYVPDRFQISKVFPNPVNAQVNFEIYVERTGEYELQLHTLTGRLVLDQTYTLRPGQNMISWNVRDLSSGNYILTAMNGGDTHTRKVVIVK